MAGLLSASSCIKRDPMPDQSNYYKNKIIGLAIEQIDMDSGDDVSLKIGALRVDNKPGPQPRISVNGEIMDGDYFTLTNSLILNESAYIETVDSAWQFVIEYSLKSNASPYTLVITPTFNDLVQEPIYFYVDKPISGKLEIKQYK